MVIVHGLIKTFKFELYLIIVLFLLLFPRFTLMLGFLLPSFIPGKEGRDVSDILGFCGAWGVTFSVDF